MDEDFMLQQPTDRRLGSNVNTLPPGPPGAEFDTVDYVDAKNAPKVEKESSSTTSKMSRSPKPSSRSRRSPSPAARRRRSPSPRRNRYRDYSPERRRYDSGRDNRRRRSPPPRDRRARGYRGGRGRSESRSRSPSPRRVSNRWSPKKKPSSPTTVNTVVSQPPVPQYSVVPSQMYNDTYANATAYNQYGVPPPQSGFPPPEAYGMQAGPPPAFNASYPPPPTWGVNADAYTQQSWMQQPVVDANQMQQMQQQVPPAAVPVNPQVQQPPSIAITAQAGQQSLNVLPDAAPGTVDPSPAHDAVAQEAENQRDELKKQRSSYLKKTSVLKKELKMLKEQRKDLNSSGPPPSPTTKGFIDENEKLQNQIQKKLSTIENVIDMLTGIIGEENLEKDQDEANDSDPSKHVDKNHHGNGSSSASQVKKKRLNTSSSSDSSTGSSSSTSSSSSSSSSDSEDDSSPERLKNKVIESLKSKQKEGIKKELTVNKAKDEKILDEKKRFNYVFYDPEMHWCQTCDIFPKTAKDFLNHLHSKEHMDRESIDTPWHLDMVTDQYPTFENATVKRTPIRGLTFFVPATAWFCKLCNLWMGDLHCASTHLKSQLHSNKYNLFLEKNPHFEVNWLADRQRVLNEKKSLPLPSQITSVSTTAGEQGNKKPKKDDDKTNKKRKKKSSDKKDKKKKKKRSKKRKKNASTTSSSESSSSDSETATKKKKSATTSTIVVKDLDNPNPAASIRVAMRKQQQSGRDDEAPPPPPPMNAHIEEQSASNAGRLGKWIVAQESLGKQAPTQQNFNAINEEDSKRDDAIIQQWNTVQPVISESEKKLLEQLKGKLKNKPRDEPPMNTLTSSSRNSAVDAPAEKDKRDDKRDKTRGNSRRRDTDTDRRRRSRSPIYGSRGGGGRGISRSRSRSRGRGGGDYRRGRRISRSRSRGRNNSPNWGRRRRSRSRSLRRRSRSYDRRRRNSRSRSRSRSDSRGRIEKAVVRHSEFRPRVPEKDKEKDKKIADAAKDKKDALKKSKPTVTTTATGKKLPFIGKMPVFKKQTSAQPEGAAYDKQLSNENPTYINDQAAAAYGSIQAARPLAPTAAQIQMAMMEDVYGNAPPFHPDAGMMDYDDLMPDPVQFVNLMGQAPPPPPPPTTAQTSMDKANIDEPDADMLPPGIDEIESDSVPKPITDGPMPRKGPLPKDLEDALNIIFPGEKKPGDEADPKLKKSSGETQIIVDEPVMQAADLVKEGIHLVTIEETSIIGMDEASQLSMNEPLVFNKPATNSGTALQAASPTTLIPQHDDTSSQNAADIDLNVVQAQTVAAPKNNELTIVNGSVTEKSTKKTVVDIVDDTLIVPLPNEIPMPAEDDKEDATSAVVYDLDDIPKPPDSPTESEKMRRQEELDDLAMLGIDADDMAAQCM